MNQKNLEIIIKENSGINRIKEPVTVGIPFPKGLLAEEKVLSLFNAKGNSIPLQTEVLANWSDKSLKWVLLDFMADCELNSTVNYYLTFQDSLTQQSSIKDTIRIEDDNSNLIINTGKTVFSLDKKTFLPFKSVIVSGTELIDNRISQVILTDEVQKEFIPRIKKIYIETGGFLRSTIKIDGQFQSDTGKVFADFISRLYFYAGRGFVKIEFTIRNSKAAKHPGNLWDLGDEGSLYFDDLSFRFALPAAKDSSIFYKTQRAQEEKKLNGNIVQIYQDSSGGVNWKSRNHVNRHGKVMNNFRGFRVRTEDLIEEGLRATPTITIVSEDRAIAATINKFWQNFPKAIEADKNTLTLRLFPHQYNDKFELQGGEQKTHTISLNFERDINESINLDWTQEPLIPVFSADWYVKTGIFKYLTVYEECKNSRMQRMMDAAVKSESTFFDKREIIDEYGWRNFGDLYADHESEEAKKYKGELPIISHYNNQYDVVHGTLRQYVKSGDRRWWELSSDLANHVVDIDIYHTDKDRYQYNHGMFWHTDHFQDAGTCSHRTYSINNLKNGSNGGGPGMAHNYTSGLLYQYLMTGNYLYKDALFELSQWVLSVINGPVNLEEMLRHKMKMIIKNTINMLRRNQDHKTDYNLDGPGRASGNCINALIDYFILFGDKKYLKMAEKVIKGCVHPQDNIEDRSLLNPEFRRWLYTIFFQAIGKFLRIKSEIGEFDESYHYAKEVLIKYAKWMGKNEYPALQKPELLDHPNHATRAAQDLRKAEIFLLASEYADDNETKDKFIQKARYFYEESQNSLLSLDTRSLTRPLAILLQNADPLIGNNNLQDILESKQGS